MPSLRKEASRRVPQQREEEQFHRKAHERRARFENFSQGVDQNNGKADDDDNDETSKPAWIKGLDRESLVFIATQYRNNNGLDSTDQIDNINHHELQELKRQAKQGKKSIW